MGHLHWGELTLMDYEKNKHCGNVYRWIGHGGERQSGKDVQKD